MKIRKLFVATAAATTLIASAVVAPAASAIDVVIDGEMCTISYTPEDHASIVLDAQQAGNTIIDTIKTEIPERAADIDTFVSAPGIIPNFDGAGELYERVDADAVAVGYNSWEIIWTLAHARSMSQGLHAFEALEGQVSRSDAQNFVEEAKPVLEDWRAGNLDALEILEGFDENEVDEQGPPSEKGRVLAEIYYGFYFSQLEAAVVAYESCADGDNGSFPLEPNDPDASNPGDENPSNGGSTISNGGSTIFGQSFGSSF